MGDQSRLKIVGSKDAFIGPRSSVQGKLVSVVFGAQRNGDKSQIEAMPEEEIVLLRTGPRKRGKERSGIMMDLGSRLGSAR